MAITVDDLKAIAPGGKKTNFKLFLLLVNYMNEYFPQFEIDTPAEYRHIISQLAHESDSFNTLQEYASGSAYEGRKDLGNIYKGDGIRFKGRGPIQTTGRNNYKILGVKAGNPNKFINNPELLETPQWGIWSACIYWSDRSLNDIANMPDDTKIWSKKLNRNLSPIEYITWRVNGGFNGLQERIKFYERAKQVIK